MLWESMNRPRECTGKICWRLAGRRVGVKARFDREEPEKRRFYTQAMAGLTLLRKVIYFLTDVPVFRRFSKYPDSISIDRDLVRDRLQALDEKIGVNRDQEKWFTRCSLCNSVLTKPDRAVTPEDVPDSVSFSYPHQVRFCPSCRRFYWPGTHREKMLARLKNWGF